MVSPGSVAFPLLMSPFLIGSTELRNRFVFQPHFTALMADDSVPNDTLREYFVERAMGGAGLIVDGHMTVMAEGMMAPHYIRAWEEDFIPHYKRIVDEVHAHGTKIFGQVTHAGHTSLTEPPQVLWAPTQMPEPSSHHTTRAMDLTDITRTVKGFGDAARNIIATGADGIEVKIAHDGLLRSFASPFFNRRTDAYGGTFEKRGLWFDP
jgi:2,4-dienoyl-CoA reductase-like NADH-dependent reductase (Old Yellow Enzyme family)